MKQVVAGKLVYVMFLEHRGLATWWNNTTTPGYVVVSATNPAEPARLVTEVGGHPLKLQYLESAYWGHNVERHIWAKYPGTFVGDYTPEIDDSGRPYIVATVYERQVAFSGEKPVGAIVLDVQTGEMTRYAMSQVPAWVDRVQPESMVRTLVEDHYKLAGGWLNAELSGQGVLKVSSMDLVYKAGRAYWYVSLTSTGKDDAIAGYVLVDSRTGAAAYTRLAGVEQDRASQIMAATTSSTMPKAYEPATVLPFAVNGKPVYVSLLLNSSHVVMGYGLVDVGNYQNSVVAATLEEAVDALGLKQSGGTGQLAELKAEPATVKHVARIGSEVRSGNTVYFIVFDSDAAVYQATAGLSDVLPLLQKGDIVTVKSGKSRGATRPLLSISL